MKLKKLLSALLAAAQLAVVSPAVFADGEPDVPFSLSYSAEEFAKTLGASEENESGLKVDIGDKLKTYGFSFDTTANGLWSIQALNDASTAYEPELRFGSRSFSSTKTNFNFMSLDFTKDTVNAPAALDADGYIFESELSIVNRDAGYLDLTLNGKNTAGDDAALAKIRFVSVKGVSSDISGKAFAAKATGVQNGNSVPVKLFSSKEVSNPGELLYVKVAVDFLNGKYSAWVVPRKDSDTDTATGAYEKTPASDKYLLVKNADLLSADAAEFTGISADLTQTRYGNAIKFKNISVTEYTPEVIEATPTPTPVIPDDGINLRMGVISDLQYGRASQDSSSIYEYAGKKFKNAVNQIIEQAGGLDKLDALLIDGDITHNSTAAEWQAFVSDLEEVVPSGGHTKVLMLRGNHDAKPDLQGNFNTYLAPYDSIYSTANNIVTVNGYTFVLISQDTQRANDKASSYPYIHSPQTISWFGEAMAEASAQSEGKPIFVGMHPAAYGTVFGSVPVEGTRGGAAATSDYWGTSELLEVLNQYPNAVTFSGHSHWDMANEMSIYQENFTALNTGAVNNMEIPDCYDEKYQPKRFGSNENESTGYYIEVDTDNITTVHRLDFYRGCEIREPWVINAADQSSWTYTKDRDAAAPYFEESAQITAENITQTGAKINFTQAKDADSNAVRYQMELVNNTTGATDKSYSISSYYWQGADMPEVNYWNVSGLEAETNYTVKITAYDDFDNASAPLTAEFKTADRPEPVPIIDVAFSGNGAVDSSEYAISNDMAVETVGEVPLTYNSELKRYEASITRTGSEVHTADTNAFFRTLLPESRRALMKTSSGYTLEAYYKPTAFNGSDNIIGAAQSQGFDIETTSDGTLEVYVNNGGGWVNNNKVYPGSAKKLTANEYYHVVAAYDGANVKVYVNGELVSTHASTGTIIFPAESGNNSAGDESYAMYIGGDYRPTKDDNDAYIAQSYAQNGFTGNIVFTKVYGMALNDREVSERYAAIEARKSLTAIDDLNEMLTVTIPAMTTNLNKALMEEYAAEGWALMAKEAVTEAEIEAYIAKAADIPDMYYELTYEDYASNMKVYGMEYDNSASGAIWSPVIVNNETSGNMPGIRFTTRGTGNMQLMKHTFVNDTINNPDAFTGDAFVFETEFTALHHNDGYLALNLLGSDKDGVEKQIAQLRFNASLAIRSGNAHFTDANGNAVGKTVGNLMMSSASNRGQPASVFYVKVAFDFVNQRYSAWLVTRKQDSGAYAQTEASDAYLLVDNAPLNFDGITTLTGYSYDLTNSSGTNGVWFRSVSVTSAEANAPAELAGAITSTAVSDGVASATAQLTKAMASPEASAELYVAVYDENGTLVTVSKTTGTVTEGKSIAEFTASADIADGQSVKFMLWDTAMNPMCNFK